MVRVLAFLLAVGLAVYALVDLAPSDERQRGGLPRGLWIVLIVFLPYLGPVAWILVRRSSDAARQHVAGPQGSAPPRRRGSGPLAPDDDPEFLWRLEQQRRRQERERRQGTDPGPVEAPKDRDDGAASPGPRPHDTDGSPS